MKTQACALLLGILLLGGCGGTPKEDRTGSGAGSTGDTATAGSATATPGGGEMAVPAWMKVNQDAKTVSADISAGLTPDNNHWNFNGYYNGNATITVPAGFKVEIRFTNKDPALAHSIGVDRRTGGYPASFENPTPVFPGAISPDPTSPQAATAPGKTDKISFSASKPGQYSLICYIPGHAAAGMWVHFNVSADGKAGFSTS